MLLGIVDILCLTLSLLVSAAIGVYQGYLGRRATPEGYLMGSRKMKALPLALSMMVGTVSAITIMGNAGEMYAYGTQLWIMDIGMVVGLILIAQIMIPIIHPMEVVSLYEYIEKRFHSKYLRQATVVLQLVGGYLYMGFLMYPPSIALQAFTGLGIFLNMFIMGATCTFYSAIGGVKAVVYTDVFQSLVMIAGVLAIIIIGCLDAGGLNVVWDIATQYNRTEFFNMNLDPYQRHSFWLCLVLGFFFVLGSFGVNQSQTQRFFSTSTVWEAQCVLYYAAGGMVFLRGLIHLSGLVIYSHFYKCDPFANTNNDPSGVVIMYVLQVLTKVPGLAGIFVASLYAAVLSSVSTQLNSMTALLWADFLKPLKVFASWSDVKAGALQKVVVLLSGFVAVALGLMVSMLGRSFLRVLFALNGALQGPLIGLFIVALLLPWIKLEGAATGFIASLILSMWLAVGQLSTETKQPFLPSSQEECPAVNGTVAQDTIVHVDDRSNVHAIYGLSYCLNSFLGVAICVLTAIIVTVFTGTNSTEDIDQSCVNGVTWRLFEKLTPLLGRKPLCRKARRSISSSLKITKGSEKKDKKAIEMVEAEEKEPLPCDREMAKVKGEGDPEGRGTV